MEWLPRSARSPNVCRSPSAPLHNRAILLARARSRRNATYLPPRGASASPPEPRVSASHASPRATRPRERRVSASVASSREPRVSASHASPRATRPRERRVSASVASPPAASLRARAASPRARAASPRASWDERRWPDFRRRSLKAPEGVERALARRIARNRLLSVRTSDDARAKLSAKSRPPSSWRLGGGRATGPRRSRRANAGPPKRSNPSRFASPARQ